MAKKTSKRPPAKRGPSRSTAAAAKGDFQLVIVESPAKAKTIEKYLGPGFVVKASIGHIRDLPSKAPKGSKQAVPGVDLEHDFAPTYEIDDNKTKTVSELRRLAKGASEVWFATDLDREGEAIAWHLTQVLGVDPAHAKRVTFDAITKAEVQRAFREPRVINMPRVEAQQARRIVDRIVGYQVSPILWKKVAGGLSAGRVQSVATRIVVEREQEIRDFTPSESWDISANMTFDASAAAALHGQWTAFMARRDERGRPPLVRDRMAWLADHRALSCDLIEVGGKPLRIEADKDSAADLAVTARQAAEAAGLLDPDVARETDPEGKGRGKNIVRITGRPDPAARYIVESIDVTRTRSRPYPPFITSTLQQAASSRLGMSTDRTMRIAQQLYEGIDVPGEGRVGLITYMRTDSTNLSKEAVDMARRYLEQRLGSKYVPEKPRSYASSNESAQEAHEAIRPTDVFRDPESIASALLDMRDGDQLLKVYRLIWQSFVACQATDAEWDSTSVRMRRSDRDTGAVFKASGRVLRFDGFYAVSGTPKDDGDQVLPDFQKGAELAPFEIETRQKFQSPPPRYTEATLVKKMEEEGIGRPSTYASIINVIENRGYVVQQDRRFHATAIGEAVTGFLKRGFRDQFIEIGYTREIERELDQVAQGTKRWTDMLHEFHDELTPKLESAMDEPHEKAKSDPSPYACPQCGRRLEYRLGGKGEFLSCSGYNEKVLVPVAAPKTTAKGKKRKPAKPKEQPACSFAMPVDRQRRPLLPEQIDLLSPAGVPMVKRTGRFGDFLVEDKPRPVKAKSGSGKGAADESPTESPPFILNLDKKGCIKFPSPPPLVTDIACPKCGDVMNLREGKRGPWLGCRAFPKCRGREAFTKLPEARQKELERDLAALMAGHTKLSLTRRDGVTPVTEGTPLASLQMEGGIAELAKFEG